MWLTRIASPDSSKITLNGIATNRETIPNAIDSLSSSPYLNNAVLGSLAKDDTYAPGRTVIRYQIKAKLLRGLLPPPLAAEDASKPEAAETETGSPVEAESGSASEEQADATSGTQEEEE
jgi:Tfp pilus assembly protein PilN